MTENHALNSAFGRRPDEEIEISSAEMTANLAGALGITQQEFRAMRDKGLITRYEVGVTSQGKVLARITLETTTAWTRLPDLRKGQKPPR